MREKNVYVSASTPNGLQREDTNSSRVSICITLPTSESKRKELQEQLRNIHLIQFTTLTNSLKPFGEDGYRVVRQFLQTWEQSEDCPFHVQEQL